MSSKPQSYQVTDVTGGEGRKPLTSKQAAGIAGVSPDTVARWCKRCGNGKQLHPKAPWRVYRVGLAIVAPGDAARLKAFLSGGD